LLAPCPSTKLLDHHLSAVRDCLFNIFAAWFDILHMYNLISIYLEHMSRLKFGTFMEVKTVMFFCFEMICGFVGMCKRGLLENST
jgi:hypothetical protein